MAGAEGRIHKANGVSEKTSRMMWVDWMRGLAILFIVFYHAVTAMDVVGAPAPYWAVVANQVASPYRIPLLMFLSGMLLAHSLRKPPGEYLLGKLRRIGWPYLVWTSVIVVFLVGGGGLFGNGNYTAASIPSIILDPRAYTWYLAYLLLFYVVALVTTPLVRAIAVPLLLAVSLVVADGDGWSRLTFLLACFFLGDLAARYPRVWGYASRHAVPLLIAGVVAVAIAWLTLIGDAARYGAVTILGVLSLLVVARFIAERASRTRVLSALNSVGRESIVYYTVHWIVIAAGANVLSRIGVQSGTLALGILLAAGLAVPWVAVVLCRRWPVLRILFEWPSPNRRRGGSVVRPDERTVQDGANDAAA